MRTLVDEKIIGDVQVRLFIDDNEEVGRLETHEAEITWNFKGRINPALFRDRLFAYLLTISVENIYTWTNVLGDDVNFNYANMPYAQVLATIRAENAAGLVGRPRQGPHMRHFGQFKIIPGLNEVFIRHVKERDFPYNERVMETVSRGVFDFMCKFIKRAEAIREITDLLHIDRSMATVEPIQSDSSNYDIDMEVEMFKRLKIDKDDERREMFKRLLVTSVYTDQSSRIRDILAIHPGAIKFPPDLRDMRHALLVGLRDPRIPL